MPKPKRQTPARPRPAEVIAARLEAGLTQKQAGELIYTALTSWQRYESGDRAMHPAAWELFQRKASERTVTR